MPTTSPSNLRNKTLLNLEAVNQFEWCPPSRHVSHCLIEARPVRLNSIPEMTSLLELEPHQECGIFLILRQGKKSSSEIVHTTISILFRRERLKKHIFAILASPQDLYTLSLFSGGDPRNLPLFFLHMNKRPLLNNPRFECLSIEFLLGIKTVTRSVAGYLVWKPLKNNALASNPLMFITSYQENPLSVTNK